MRVYYFDDSGNRGNDPQNPYLVIGGFGIDADQVHELRRRVHNACLSYGFPTTHPNELKFNQVGRGKDNNPNKPHWMLRAGLSDRSARRALVYSVLRAALSTPSVSVISVAVDQRETYGDRKAIELAMEPLFERIQMDSSTRNSKYFVMMDEEQADDKSLRSAIRSGSFHLSYSNLLDSISFMPSEESPGIQVADLVAGGVSRYLNSQDPGYIRVFWKFIRNSGGRRDRYGVKIYPRGRCETPPVRLGPWSDFDREIHEHEIKAEGSKQLEWWPNGTPSLIFPTDENWSDI